MEQLIIELGERFIRLGDVADVEKGAGVGAEEQRRAEEDHPHENVGEEEEVQAENGLKPQRIGAAVLQVVVGDEDGAEDV